PARRRYPAGTARSWNSACRFGILGRHAPPPAAAAIRRACLVVAMPALSRFLEEAGFEPALAATESEALALLERREFGAVLAAQRLGAPALDAVIAAAGHRQPEVPVLVLGASATLQDA